MPRDLARVTRSSNRRTWTRFWRTCWRTFLGFKELVLVCCDGFGISGLAIFVKKCRYILCTAFSTTSALTNWSSVQKSFRHFQTIQIYNIFPLCL
ncbi:hypothetical protein ES319_A07G188400v1 [Gossypium barbadense]|uniref:Uncharacterized protein n=1 Tax=Gossypium barbadense TaxID=3634 RepID=A0A5J5V5J6_GOSBA|nr:hypothetical protein ES319_A07G188400v1 [Gossypium barbadense]